MEEIYFIAMALLALGLLLGALYERRVAAGERARARRFESEKAAVIQLMDNIGERMTQGIDLDETLKVIADYVVKATQAESGAIYLLNPAGEALQAKVIIGLFPPLFEDEEGDGGRTKYLAEKIRKRLIAVGEGIVGAAVEQNRPTLITDAEADPRLPRKMSTLTPVESLILCPMRVRARPLGVMIVANKLGGAIFDAQDMLLLQALADQAAVTVDLVRLHDALARQQRLEQELQIAKEFQTMLLPSSCPVIEGYEFSALNQTALMVGGDFYDFFMLDDTHLGIVIADVSGKGIPGALIMAMVRSNIRAEARDTLSPKDALRPVNERLLIDTKENVFVTVTYAVLDIPNRRMKLVRAGHEPILIRRGDEYGGAISSLTPEGMAVGLLPGSFFENTEEVELELHPGDMALLYTDGAIEAENAAAEQYGRPRLIERLARAGDSSPAELVASLAADIDRFAKGIPQHDDITLLAIKVAAGSKESARERELAREKEPAREAEAEAEAEAESEAARDGAPAGGVGASAGASESTHPGAAR